MVFGINNMKWDGERKEREGNIFKEIGKVGVPYILV